MNLRTCLDQCSLGLLRQIAAGHGLAVPEPPARAEVVDALVARLEEPGYLDGLLAGLEPGEQQVLELVARDGGEIRGFVLERQLRQGPAGSEVNGGPPAAVGRLLGRGLLYRAFQAVGPERGEVFLIPDEVDRLLPHLTPPERAPIGPVDEPAETRACAPCFNLFAMASFVRRWRQRAARSGRESSQLEALAEEAAELAVELPERTVRERWTLLAHLGLREALFTRDAAGLQPTERFEEWLAEGEAGAHRLWRSYLESDQWNDLERAGSGAHRFAGRTAEPVLARAEVLRVLAANLSERWVLAADVDRLLREQAPDFLREAFEASRAELVDLESGELLGGAQSWDRVEAAFLRYLLSGPLYWLGLLEWGRGPESWDRLRLTRSGLAWLAGSENLLLSPLAPLELSGEGRLLAQPAADLALLWQLEPYLTLERRGPPSRYLLSRASFGRGLAAGGSAAELRRLLERAAGGSLPLELAVSVQRWTIAAGRFKLRPMVVLSAADASELEAVIERLGSSGLLRERLGPLAAVVAPGRGLELAEQLERLGQLPEVDASLRLMAGRRAYAAQVDQSVLEALLYCLRLVRSLDPGLSADLPQADRLVQRLEQALGPIAAPRIVRRARAAARRLKSGSVGSPRGGRSFVPPST
jgi:hypothetical protein